MKKKDDSTLTQSISQVTTSWDKENYYYYYIHPMNKHNLFLVTPIPDIISFLIL